MTTSLGTALITGASAGIGAIYADRLAHRGHDLILVARDGARMQALATRLRAAAGVRVEVLAADLTDEADLARLEQRLADDPAITLLVNNASMTLRGGLLDNTAAAVTQLITLNITAPTRLAAAAARAFLGRKAGAIINIGSVTSLIPERFDGVYSGSKAYILNLTQSLAQAEGLRVQAVLPGATRTDIWEKAGTNIDAAMPGMVMDAGEMVDAALTGFDRGEVVTIPPLHDAAQWAAYEAARLALAPNLSTGSPAPRYRAAIAA